MRPRPFITLNLDVLNHILSMIDEHSDLLLLMRTCRALYTVGIQPLVRRPISITERNIRSYHTFMFAHSPATFLALWSFTFDGSVTEGIPWQYPVKHSNQKLIVDLLKRGSNLRHIEVPAEVFEDHPDLCDTVGALTQLEELRIPGLAYYDTGPSIASRLHSPLSTLHLHFGTNYIDPIPLLADTRHTLEIARLSRVKFRSTEVCYPRMKDLHLLVCASLWLPIVTTVFPNLESLFVDDERCLSFEGDLEPVRMNNIAFQEGRKSWASLSSVTGSLASLHVMALEHEVDSFKILQEEGYQEGDFQRLQHVLSAIKPKYLSLTVPDYDGPLPRVFDGLVTQGPLRQLDLELQLCQLEDHEEFLQSVIEALSPVRTFMLYLNFRVFDARSRGRRPIPRDHPARDFIDDFDEGGFVYQIRESLSVGLIVLQEVARSCSEFPGTLASICLDTNFGLEGEPSWHDFDPEKMWELLDSEVFMSVITRLGYKASFDWEYGELRLYE